MTKAELKKNYDNAVRELEEAEIVLPAMVILDAQDKARNDRNYELARAMGDLLKAYLKAKDDLREERHALYEQYKEDMGWNTPEFAAKSAQILQNLA